MTFVGIWSVWVLPLLAAAGADSSSLDAFLEELGERRAEVRTVQASFVQDEISPDDSIRSEGTLVYRHPRRIVFRYIEPEIAYLVDGLRVYEHDSEFEQVQAFDLDADPEAEALFLGFGGDPSRLLEAYALELRPAGPEACGTQILTLRPNVRDDEEVAQESLHNDSVSGSLFQEARLTLTGDELLPCRIEIVNDEESRIVINIVQYAVNQPIESDVDRLRLPEGTRIIENDALVEVVDEGGALLPREADGGATETP